jgi:hypothetical protein
MRNINGFNINRNDLAATASSRQYTVNGEKDAEFILQVFDTPSGSSDPVAFYDFATKSFSVTFTSTSSLNVKMNSTSFSDKINFPANASGDTYTILLLTPPDKDTILTLSTAQNFNNDITLTFQARGGSVIKKAIGIDLDFSNWNSNVNTVTLPTPFTKTIRATGSDEDIALSDTYGITGGGLVTIKGLNVVNTSANTIQSVTADVVGSSGEITVQVAQTTALAVGTVIRLSGSGIGKGSRETLDIDNEITINSHPSSNREIFLNLDNFIEPGEAS